MNRNEHPVAQMRLRPGMFLGAPSLERLRHFLDGYRHALFIHQISQEPGDLNFDDFFAWLNDTLHTTPGEGWVARLIALSPDEAQAWEHFFALLDQYQRAHGSSGQRQK